MKITINIVFCILTAFAIHNPIVCAENESQYAWLYNLPTQMQEYFFSLPGRIQVFIGIFVTALLGGTVAFYSSRSNKSPSKELSIDQFSPLEEQPPAAQLPEEEQPSQKSKLKQQQEQVQAAFTTLFEKQKKESEVFLKQLQTEPSSKQTFQNFDLSDSFAQASPSPLPESFSHPALPGLPAVGKGFIAEPEDMKMLKAMSMSADLSIPNYNAEKNKLYSKVIKNFPNKKSNFLHFEINQVIISLLKNAKSNNEYKKLYTLIISLLTKFKIDSPDRIELIKSAGNILQRITMANQKEENIADELSNHTPLTIEQLKKMYDI